MEILSISIDDETKKRLGEIQKRLGFKSRSKLLRDAVLAWSRTTRPSRGSRAP